MYIGLKSVVFVMIVDYHECGKYNFTWPTKFL